MATQIKRTGDIGQNFEQVTTGETPNSVAVSLNAKGQAQLEVKIYYASAAHMAQFVADDLATIFGEVKRTLAAQGIPLAGDVK